LHLPIQVHGKALRASNKPLQGKIVLETSGGKETVLVRADVPVTPFAEGVLAGARSPREAATKAKANPRDAAPLFESGAVERWYRANGWSYPVLGPSSMGLGAVQQFFEALGLVQPPQVEINETKVHLAGKVGERQQHSIKVTAIEPRPVYAYAVSDQPWLTVGKVVLSGKVAVLPLVVEAIPDRPGEQLHAVVTVTANGMKRFTVQVFLAVSGTRTAIVEQPIRREEQKPASIPVLDVVPDSPPVPAALPWRVRLDPDSWPRWRHALPLGVLFLALLIVIIRDFFASGTTGPEGGDDNYPYIGVLFQDKADADIGEPTQRFGLVMLRERDPRDPRKLKKLTYRELGHSNNVCILLDGQEYLFGQNLAGHKPGKWETVAEPPGNEEEGEQGRRSVWLLDEGKVAITQMVEVIRGEQTGKLDTCLVRYTITNRDSKAHTVGLRFLLDTYIGANDGVPFTIPGDKRLCDTFLRFDRAELVPDFIQALERQDLEDPGTVAHLQLRLGGRLESPSRVTLGCWPENLLAVHGKAPKALAERTGWDVPVLSMRALLDLKEELIRQGRADPRLAGEVSPDSAVTMYWDPKTLLGGATREVGFSYGLGAIATAGKLGLTVGGSFRPGGTFTLTAYVGSPVPGQTLTLDLPAGFDITSGDKTQPVPPLPPDAARRTSPVTWKIRSPGRGRYDLKVTSSTGTSQTQTVTIQSNRLFD
jgi:hypothetical protein